MDSLINRRRFKRSKVEVQVGILKDDKVEFGLGVQIGEGGMLLILPEQLKRDDEIEISFSLLSKKRVIAVRAKVLYVFPYGRRYTATGLCFMGLSRSAQELIRGFVERLDSI